MQTIGNILSTLESLSSADRQWIVERLPDEAKSLLMNELVTATDASIRDDECHSTGKARLTSSKIERIPADVAASILESEAPWIVAVILQSANTAWTTQVVRA